MMAGASLTIEGGSLSGGSGAAGGGENGGANGQAFGAGIFLQGNETITLGPVKGTTERVFDIIADQTGSDGTGANAGAGGLTLDGTGTLDLIAANTFTGGTTIERGVLELANAAAAGQGGIDFASTTGKIEYAAAGANLANAISGFRGKDRIDFALVSFAPGDHAVDNSGKVSVETSTGVTVATFNVSGTDTSANFHVGKDASGHVLVTFVATAANAIDEVRGGSAADLLGAPGAEFPSPTAETNSGAAGLDPLLSPFPSAESDPGGFAYHYDRNVGGARDTWGVGAGWDGALGHGPGSAS